MLYGALMQDNIRPRISHTLEDMFNLGASYMCEVMNIHMNYWP